MTDTRYPLAPLAAHLGIDLGQIGGHQPGQDPTGMAALTERLGVSTTSAYNYRRHGLTADQADRLAVRAGVHPSIIWPTWWADCPPEIPPAGRRNAAKTHCPAGHAYDHIDNRGYRVCRQCRRRQLKECRRNREAPAQSTRFTPQCLPGLHD